MCRKTINSASIRNKIKAHIKHFLYVYFSLVTYIKKGREKHTPDVTNKHISNIRVYVCLLEVKES